jgi:DNA polymerase
MDLSNADLSALLTWYRDAGVDIALGDEPVDRFEESRREAEARRIAPPLAAKAPNATASSPALNRPVPLPPERPRTEPAAQPMARPSATTVLPDAAAVDNARAAAASAQSLDDLKAILERFDGCGLKQTARRLVFADGQPGARLMFIGEAPGRDEDEQGLPFVGRSGQLLDRMLGAIGLERAQCYIANVVPWRPPGNRTPTPQEVETCRPFVIRQIELVAPEIVVFLGGASAAALAGTSEGILKLRGRWLNPVIGGAEYRAMATLHPAYLLRQPLQKRLAWRDFRQLAAALGLPAPLSG